LSNSTLRISSGNHRFCEPRRVALHLCQLSGNGHAERELNRLNPSACVIDELHHPWHSGRQLEFFDALDTAAHKPPGAF
jgi:hypothetical protein